MEEPIRGQHRLSHRATTHSRFSTLVTESATKSSYSPGGVRSLPQSMVDKQGLLQSSASDTDLAIAGDGFFVVNNQLDPNSIEANYLWTRAGSFTPDANGNLRNAAGHYLQAWKIDPSGNIPANRTDLSALETVNITGLTGNAEPTSAIGLKLLDPKFDPSADILEDVAQVLEKINSARPPSAW